MPAYRRYTYSRRRRYPKRVLRTLRNARMVRRMYPPSKFGYVAVPRTELTRSTYGLNYRRATDIQKQARIRDKYYGRGGYFTKAWRNVIRPIGSAALTGALGGARSAALNLLTGSGMYTGDGAYQSNDLVTEPGPSSSIPEFSSSADETGALTISHKEYVRDVYGNELVRSSTTATVPFTNATFQLNPGLESSFPWLSQIAANYEEYEFKQLIYTYKSIVADVSSNNGQVGTIIMATQYNPSLPPFTNKGDMMSYAHSASAKSTDDMVHGVECDPAKLSGDPGKYIRTSPVLLSEDAKDYDLGTFNFAVANTPVSFVNASIGELWVSYTVVLRKPKIVTAKGNTISRILFVGPKGATSPNTLDTDYLRNTLLGTSSTTAQGYPLRAQQSNLPISYTKINATPAGGPFLVGGPCYYTTPGGTLTEVMPSSVNQPKNCTILTLPSQYSGVLQIKLQCEALVTTPSTLAAQLSLNAPGLSGNISPWSDIYSTFNGAEPSSQPNWFVRTSQFVPTSATNEVVTLVMIAHIKVEPASNSIPNQIFWSDIIAATSGNNGNFGNNMLFTATSGTGSATYAQYNAALDITEYNSSLAQSPSNPEPLFVTLKGVQEAYP